MSAQQPAYALPAVRRPAQAVLQGWPQGAARRGSPREVAAERGSQQLAPAAAVAAVLRPPLAQQAPLSPPVASA